MLARLVCGVKSKLTLPRTSDPNGEDLRTLPGSDEPFEKETFYTKVVDQICGVGYYKK